jgi:hypothetical protein
MINGYVAALMLFQIAPCVRVLANRLIMTRHLTFQLSVDRVWWTRYSYRTLFNWTAQLRKALLVRFVDAIIPMLLHLFVLFVPTMRFPTRTKWFLPLDIRVGSLNTLLPPKIMPVPSLARFTEANTSLLAAKVHLTPTLLALQGLQVKPQ